jgi:2-dehydropantoate 2-reductase
VRYVIIGAGAIGGVLGARLAQHSLEHPPLLIARGAHGEAIRRNGLRLRTPDDDVRVPVQVASSPEEVRLDADDVLVLATKTQQAEAALLQWVDRPVHAPDGEVLGIAGESLPVLTALNGIASEGIALRYFARVFGVCVWMPATHLVPGEVMDKISPTSGAFLIGRYAAAATDDDRELLTVLKRDWEASSILVHLVDEVMRWKYTKLLSNLGNAVQALLGADSSGYPGVVARLRAEAEAVYREAGIEWVGEEEEAARRGDLFSIRPIPGVTSEVGGSSWQSIARGSGSIETDFLNGEIALMARSRGGRAPLNEVVQRLARRAAATAAPTASMTGDELERELDGALSPAG